MAQAEFLSPEAVATLRVLRLLEPLEPHPGNSLLRFLLSRTVARPFVIVAKLSRFSSSWSCSAVKASSAVSSSVSI